MDYDQWNIPGWSSADVLSFFKAIEHVDDAVVGDLSPEFHSQGGDWVMDHVRYQNPLSKRFLEVGEAAGLGTNKDFNDWSRPQDGVGRFHVSEINGERCTGAMAFLEKARKRPNLTIRSMAMARKINFNEQKTATGVTYNIVGDDTFQNFCANLAAGGEVILTAGAIASPQLLMCSGIGPARHLRSLGIPIVHDNPNVGDNLQDHPAAVVSFGTPEKGVSVTSKLRLWGKTNPFPILQWLVQRKGVLTSVGCDHGAFVRVTPEAIQPDLQFRFLAAKALGPDGMTTYTQFRSMASIPDGYSFQCVSIRAKSQGRIRLASSNSNVKPIVDLGYLSDERDLVTLREGIKLARSLGRRPEWKEYLGTEVYPGPEIQTDQQIEEYIRNTVHTTNALVGTCKMGTGPDAVVGRDLIVLGVQGLRVADSSVIPIIPGGQTGTPTVMIAERAAHLLKCETITGEELTKDTPEAAEEPGIDSTTSATYTSMTNADIAPVRTRAA